MVRGMGQGKPTLPDKEFLSLVQQNAYIREVVLRWLDAEIEELKDSAYDTAVAALFDSKMSANACVLQGRLQTFQDIRARIDRVK